MNYTRVSQPTRTRTLITAGVIALLCSGVAACSSDSPKTGAPASASHTDGAAPSSEPASSLAAPGANGRSVDPCTLLTPAEAASLLGGPAQHKADPPKVIVQANGLDVTGHTCDYSLVTSDQLGHDIRIEVEAGATRSYFDQDIQPSDETAISGLGDVAFGSSNHVKVFSKNTMLQVYGSLAAADGLQQAARLAIAKL